MDITRMIDRVVYGAWGVAATITPDAGAPVSVRVIDATDPSERDLASGIDLHSIVPMARARMREVTESGLTPVDLSGAVIVFNGKSWRIDTTRTRPTHKGEADGEIELHLSEVDEDE